MSKAEQGRGQHEQVEPQTNILYDLAKHEKEGTVIASKTIENRGVTTVYVSSPIGAYAPEEIDSFLSTLTKGEGVDNSYYTEQSGFRLLRLGRAVIQQDGGPVIMRYMLNADEVTTAEALHRNILAEAQTEEGFGKRPEDDPFLSGIRFVDQITPPAGNISN